MHNCIMRRITAIAVLLLSYGTVVTVCVGPAVAAPRGSRWGANYFPNVPLVTQDGRSVHFYDDLIKDKIVVINFIYTSCQDACPLETARLVQVQKLLGDRVGRDIFLYSITIDPTRDTPAVLKQYAASFHVRPGWVFLTGRQEDIDLIRTKLGMLPQDSPNTLSDHLASLIIGNEANSQWMRHAAFEDPQYLAAMIGDWLSNWQERKVVQSYANVSRPPAPEKGQYLFRTRCAACHTIGKGDGVGPDLAGVTSRRDRAWLSRWLAAPDQMLAEHDPIATALLAKYQNVLMPNLHLSETDVAALIAYMEAQSIAQQETARHETPTAQ